MRLSSAAHTSRPWRIHALTADFLLEDVWALPTPGGPTDFPRLVHQMSSGDPAASSSRVARALWAIRWRVGELLGWDGPDGGRRSDRPTLRDRLPADLREGPSGPQFEVAPFESLYLLEDEWAAEIVNKTVHGVLHIGWVPDQGERYRGEMAVYVKPNGFLGNLYLATIRPFRHRIVYPPLMREIEREWLAGADKKGRFTREAAKPLSAACTLTSEEGAERRRVWEALADHALIEQRETERGVTVSYLDAPGVEEKLRELVALEAECCDFADWRVEPRGARIVLEVTAPDEAVPALQAIFAR